ncbi:MAG: HEAT repeat domain-containing protein [Phycisphaerae bacterium]
MQAAPWTDKLAALRSLPAAAACDELEKLLLAAPDESAARAVLAALHQRLPDAGPPPTPDEQRALTDIRRDNPAGAELLAGRYTLTLATPKFAATARQMKLPVLLDLAYLLERDLFAIDPVRLRGHRFYIFPRQDKPGGYTTHTDWLTVAIGRGDWDNGDCLEPLVHELAHPFINIQTLEHWRGGGLGEGWAEFCKAYVARRLAFLGPPFPGRWDYFVAGFRHSGQVEYLDTRLPIEEIINYDPSSSFLMALTLAADRAESRAATASQLRRSAEISFRPWKRLFSAAAGKPPLRFDEIDWPGRVALDARQVFGRPVADPILTRYRFPLPAMLDAAAARLARGPLSPFDAATRRRQWQADGFVVADGWRVIGPIPDARGRQLAFDPIDVLNLADRPSVTLDGAPRAWGRTPPGDPCGTVLLSALPGGSAASVFFLETRLDAHGGDLIDFRIASDDDAACWLDGQRFHVFWGTRAVDVDQPDRAFAAATHDAPRLRVQVANHGGPAGLHIRYRVVKPADDLFRASLADPDAARRAAAVAYLGAWRGPDGVAVSRLAPLLQDAAPAVRRAAASALAGRRSVPAAAESLARRWVEENEPSVLAALRDGLYELTFRRFGSGAEAERWLAAHAAARRGWSFVECEFAWGRDPLVGGFFGNQPAAFGHQCLDRGWGSTADQFIEVTLAATETASRTLDLRYACAHPHGSRMSFTVRRGEQIVVEQKGVPVPRTRDWNTFAWLHVPLGELPPGCYRVAARTDGRNVDCDVIGWK